MLFTFPSRYWSTIGLQGVFSLAGWARRIHAGLLVSRATQDSATLRHATCTQLSCSMAALSRAFHSRASCDTAVLQPRRRRNADGLGSSPVARHYWGNHSCFLFLRVLRCFSSPRWPPDYAGCRPFRTAGCPIRGPADQRLHAPPRGLSQLAAPFIASWSLGIHHTPLFTFAAPPHIIREVLYTSAWGTLRTPARFFLYCLSHHVTERFFLLWRITDSNR